MADVTTDPAVSVCFSVNIDGHPLGSFMSCDGLSFQVHVEEREEGGNNAFVHQLPGRIKYSTVKFTRPINSDSNLLVKWFSQMTVPIQRTQAEIQAMTLDGEVVATWKLTGVIPVKWSGPSMSSESPKVATETLEIAHHGFLNMG
jgi:phage tail-like protein